VGFGTRKNASMLPFEVSSASTPQAASRLPRASAGRDAIGDPEAANLLLAASKIVCFSGRSAAADATSVASNDDPDFAGDGKLGVLADISSSAPRTLDESDAIDKLRKSSAFAAQDVTRAEDENDISGVDAVLGALTTGIEAGDGLRLGGERRGDIRGERRSIVDEASSAAGTDDMAKIPLPESDMSVATAGRDKNEADAD
jgi:hypothetical protein